MKKSISWISAVKKIALFIFFLCTGMSFLVGQEQYREEKRQGDLQKLHISERETTVAETPETILRGVCPDYLGWLKVPDVGIDLPVVQGEDNEYYLTHDAEGNRSRYGALFADCRAKKDGNLLIYGHHMKNGSMFGRLTELMNKETFEATPLIRWEDDEGETDYTVFAVLVIPGSEEDPDYFPVRKYLGDLSGRDRTELLEQLEERAVRWRRLSFSETDRFLFLLTCDYTKENGRLLVCARRTS